MRVRRSNAILCIGLNLEGALGGASTANTKENLESMGDTKTTNEILFYSTTWCGDCRRSRRVLDAMGIAYKDIDIEEYPDAADVVRKLNDGMQSVPTILFPDGTVLVEPSNAALEQKLTAMAAAH